MFVAVRMRIVTTLVCLATTEIGAHKRGDLHRIRHAARRNGARWMSAGQEISRALNRSYALHSWFAQAR